MSRIDLLKNALYQLINENQELLEVIQEINDKYQQILEICISNNKTSSAWHCSCKIILGIKNLPILYEICEEVAEGFNIVACKKIESKYSSYGNDGIHRYVNIVSDEKTEPYPSDIIYDTNLFTEKQNDSFSAVDTLVLFALDYSICHEVGHLLLDSERKNIIDKEDEADYFAFETISKAHDIEKCTDQDLAESRLIGTFIGIASVLLFREPECENRDTDHPHTIERMLSMLKNWQVENNSSLWEIGCYIIEKWANRNGILLPWNKENTLSFHDKFLVACSKINEKHQYI